MSGKKSSSPDNQDIKRFFMVRQESALPSETEKSDSKQDGGIEKQNQKRKQQIDLH